MINKPTPETKVKAPQWHTYKLENKNCITKNEYKIEIKKSTRLQVSIQFILDDLPTQFVAVSVCGRFGLWPFRSVAVPVCGRSGLWPFRFVAVPVCGRFGLWPFRSVALSVCGRFGFGRFGLWPLWPETVRTIHGILVELQRLWCDRSLRGIPVESRG